MKKIRVSLVREMEVSDEDYKWIVTFADEFDMQGFLEMTELTYTGLPFVSVESDSLYE